MDVLSAMSVTDKDHHSISTLQVLQLPGDSGNVSVGALVIQNREKIHKL